MKMGKDVEIRFNCGHVKEAWIPNATPESMVEEIKAEMATYTCESCGLEKVERMASC